MNVLEWLRLNLPGSETAIGDELRIRHESGDVSSLWQRRPETHVPSAVARLRELYETFNGIDLASSSFKIASIDLQRTRHGVLIVPTLHQLSEMAATEGCRFRVGVIPFMMQAGIGFYGVDQLKGSIYEWDSEVGEITDEYSDVLEIFDEWLNAVRQSQ